MEYQIGDFSKISRLSIKTLRFYHELGLLEPCEIKDESGYRYYSEKSLEKAKIITELKTLDFSLKEIKEILDNYDDDSEIFDYLQKKYWEVDQKVIKYEEIRKKIDFMIKQEVALKMLNQPNEIIIKDIPDILVATIRFKGKYIEVGNAFMKLGQICGRYFNGAGLSLYYDQDYNEDNADIEVCAPVKHAVNTDEIKSRVLKGGKALTKIHLGPYEAIGTSYKVLLDYINQNNITVESPSREVYLKGPGFILPRSPKKFITEIQLLIESK